MTRFYFERADENPFPIWYFYPDITSTRIGSVQAYWHTYASGATRKRYKAWAWNDTRLMVFADTRGEACDALVAKLAEHES